MPGVRCSKEPRRSNRGAPPDLANNRAIRNPCVPPAAEYSPRIIHFILDHSRLSTPCDSGAPRPGIVIDDITHGAGALQATHRLHATHGVTVWELLAAVAVPPRCFPLRRRGRGRRRRRPRRPRSAGSRRRCGSSGRVRGTREEAAIIHFSIRYFFAGSRLASFHRSVSWSCITIS